MVALLLAVTGCGSKKNTSTEATPSGSAAQTTGATPAPKKTHFAKTKFVIHAGLAFGAFHRWIYKPLKAGTFSGKSLLRNKKALFKAGLAGLFAYHELKLALKDAKSSPLLTKLLTPVTALANKLKSIGTGLKRGKVDQAAIESTNSDIAAANGAASAAGSNIQEKVPSALQLAKG
jgi:hypothetical protein